MAKRQSILDPADVAELNRALQLIHQLQQDFPTFEHCGVDCADAREITAYAFEQLNRIKDHIVNRMPIPQQAGQ